MNTATREETAALALQPVETQQLPAVPPAAGALAVSSPAGIMLAAMAQGITPADMREMLALQREWQADQARAAMNQALAAFKTEAITILKRKMVGYETSKGELVGYKHAELFDVVAAVGPALAKHGLSYRWDVKQTKDWITVTCILKHSAGHSESCEMGGPPDNSGKKNAIQSIASTVSYLQRYTLKAITGVAEGGDDDDGQGGADRTANVDGNAQEPQAEQAPAFYPQEGFEKNLPSWRKLIAEGKKSAAEIFATVQKKAPLSESQKQAITASD